MYKFEKINFQYVVGTYFNDKYFFFLLIMALTIGLQRWLGFHSNLLKSLMALWMDPNYLVCALMAVKVNIGQHIDYNK